MKEFLSQLNKRRVTRVALAYLVIGWLVLQVADVVLPAMGLPEWAMTLVLVIVAAGFPIALILSWVFDIGPEGIERTSYHADPVPEQPKGLSIAVLPFPDLSAEQDQGHFCDGLTDELISRLTRVSGLRVASRSSSFAFRRQNSDLKAAAEKLGVQHILEGGVRKDGNRLRISAQLTEVASDSVLWAENYDHELCDIFAVQKNLAECILVALKLQLGADELKKPRTENPKAYEYYLRGLGYALVLGQRELALAQAMFEKATQADPGFTEAWVGLAEVTAVQVLFLGAGEEAHRISDLAGQRALELAPGEGTSQMAYAFSQMACECHEDAETAFLKALELDPALVRAWHFLGRNAHHAGEQDKEIEYFQQAIEHDPDDWESPLLVLAPLRQQGKTDEVERIALLGMERLENYLEDYPDNRRAYYLGANARAMLGDIDQARRWAEKAYQLAPDDPSTRYNLACFYAQIGDEEHALDLLENSITSRSWIENDPDLDSLRDHPRYREFLDRIAPGSD